MEFAGNYYDKYNSKNPLIKYVVSKFKKDLNKIIKATKAKKILDVGCGEGYLINYIKMNNPVLVEGKDLSKKLIIKARKTYPKIKFSVGNIYNLNCISNSFDLVLACEILEHLENPFKAIIELKRVTKKFCIISVPNEPLWRVANILRGAYLKNFGNTPGHVQHWTKKQFKNLLKNHFKQVFIKKSILWNIAICKK